MNASGSLVDALRSQQQRHTVAVPTNDVDVKKMLRSLKQPICLFGEDPKDRKDRLRNLLSQASAHDLPVQEEPEYIPKYEVGGDDISDLKQFLITFSVPRCQARIRNERPIDQDRVDEANLAGRCFRGYELIASELADRRPLTSLSTFEGSLAVAGLSGSVALYSVASMERHRDVQLHSNRATDVTFVNASIVCSSSADQSVGFWNVESGAVGRIEFDGLVHCVSTHPSQRIVIAGLSDGTVGVVDVERQQPVCRMKSNDGIVSTVSCHSDGGLIIVGGIDKVGRLWDLRSMRSIKVLQAHVDRVTCSTFGSSGFHVVTGSADHSMIVWDMRNLRRSKRISGHTSTVSSLDAKGDLLLSSSLDLSMKVWSLLDFRTYLTIKQCPSPVVACGFAESADPQKPFIVSASRDGSCRLYHEDVI
jgi:U4/U6 small nuclear ribonucleoprotein PRP4